MTRRGLSPRVGALALLFAALVAVPFVLAGNAGATTPAPRTAVACQGGTYTVVKGDGWWLIASRLKVTMAALLAANDATVATVLHPGDVLCVPAGGATTTTAKASATTAGPTVTTAKPTVTTAPATATTQPAPPVNVTIARFPVQGLCFYVDTWGAPRSGGRKHQGVDILARTGNLVYAADDGTLTKQYVDGPGSLSGNGWRLTRADGTYYFYGHFSRFADGLKVGSTVKAGQIIGYVGMTGNAGAPHLHFEVHPKGGAAVNPTPIVRQVDGCMVTAVPPQPGATTPTSSPAGPTTTTKPAVTTTTKPAVTTTTKPAVTTTTKPAVTTTTKPAVTTTTQPPQRKWQFVQPVLAYNSVLAGQRLPAGTAVQVPIKGLAGVDAATSGVLVRLVARNITSSGTISLHACGAKPGAAALSFAPGRVAAAVVSSAVANGSFCITASSSVDVRVAVMAQRSVSGVAPQASAGRTVLNDFAMVAGRTVSLAPATLGQSTGSEGVSLTVTVKAPTSAGSLGIGTCGGVPWIVAYPAAPTQTYSLVVPNGSAGVCVTSSVNAAVTLTVTGQWVR